MRFFLLLCICLSTSLFSGCSRAEETAADAPSPPPTLPQLQLDLIAPNGAHIPLLVELAQDDPSRQRGLMHRNTLPLGTGMLFVWPHAQPVHMWMRNTKIPLDILFLQHNTVVHIETNMRPYDETPRGPNFPVDMALEIPAGMVKLRGITHGWGISLTLPVAPTQGHTP